MDKLRLEDLVEVLWVYISQSSIKETPFKLVHNTDAIIPMEIGEPSP